MAVPGLAAWLGRVAPPSARGVVNVALVSDVRVRALNRAYRRKDYATDVLSFPANSPPRRTLRTRRSKPVFSSVSSASSVVESFLGDIVIARGVAKRQARDARHSELTELKVLAIKLIKRGRQCPQRRHVTQTRLVACQALTADPVEDGQQETINAPEVVEDERGTE